MRALATRGVTTRRGIMNAHQESACDELAPHPPLSASEAARDRTFLLPLYDGLSAADQGYVLEQIARLARQPRPEASEL